MGGTGIGGPGIGADAQALADFFGIDAATLRTELETKSLATIASEHGKSVDQLKALLSAEVQARLAEKVAAGDLTQEEADARLAEMQSRLDEEINEVHAHGPGQPRGPRPEMAPSTN
jgi:hypothetical protein